MAATPYREYALRYAIEEIGVKEHPAGSNRGPRVDMYQEADSLTVPDHGYPWCMSFQNFIFNRAGRPLSELGKTASVPVAVQRAREKGWTVRKDRLQRGDIVVYDFPGGSSFNHVGIVRKRTSPTTFNAVEGNTSITSDDNGGEVMLRSRSLSQVSAVIRVPGAPRARVVLRTRDGKVHASTDVYPSSFRSDKTRLAMFAANKAGLFVRLLRERRSPRFAIVKVS